MNETTFRCIECVVFVSGCSFVAAEHVSVGDGQFVEGKGDCGTQRLSERDPVPHQLDCHRGAVCRVDGAVDRVRGGHFLSAVQSVCDVVDGAARSLVLSLDSLQRRTHRQSGRTHQPIRVGVAEAVQCGTVLLKKSMYILMGKLIDRL